MGERVCEPAGRVVAARSRRPRKPPESCSTASAALEPDARTADRSSPPHRACARAAIAPSLNMDPNLAVALEQA